MTTPLPAGLQTGGVSWTVSGVAPDSMDADNRPEAIVQNGIINFTPQVSPARLAYNDGVNPVTLLATTQPYQIINNKLVDAEGRDVVQLIASDSEYLSPVGWKYLAEYELNDGTFGSFLFELHAGETINLTTYVQPGEVDDVTIITQGPAGMAATVEVGLVTTIDSDQPADVDNSGDEHNAVLNFYIPKGADGVDGADGQGYGGGIAIAPVDPDEPLTLDIESPWGINAVTGDAYYDSEGAAPAEAALLVPNLVDGEFYLFQPGDPVEGLPTPPHTHTGADITDAADEVATPGTLVRRTAGGSGVFDNVYSNKMFGYDSTAPTDPAQLIRKDWFDAGLATKATPADITAASTADRNRANHTGTQTSTTISDFTEAVQDAVAALLGAGSNVILTYDDAANSLTVSATGSGGTGLDAEQVRDTIGVAMVGVGVISVTVNDAADTITISSTATANSTDAALRDRSTHTGTQSADSITDGTTNKAYTATEKSKLAGIATAATANAADAFLLDRANHSGTQLISTVSGLQTALDGKVTAFADPNADRIVFWDDSAGAFAALVPGTGLTISGTTITPDAASATASGIVELATTAETTTGTDTIRAVTPAGVKAATDAERAGQEGIAAWTGSAWPSRPTGYARIRWTGGTTAPFGAVSGDVWERDA